MADTAAAVLIDTRVGLRYPIDVSLVGDSRRTLDKIALTIVWDKVKESI